MTQSQITNRHGEIVTLIEEDNGTVRVWNNEHAVLVGWAPTWMRACRIADADVQDLGDA